MNENELRRFDFNLLLILHVLLEERSVGRAGERLALSQSAVSHALMRLRAALGDPLLVRSRHIMIPTPRAEQLAEGLRDILGRTHHLISPPTFDARRQSGVFRMTATDYGSLIVLPELMRHLAANAPGLAVEVHVWTPETLPNLQTGAIDLALGGQNPFEDFENEPLFTDRLTLVVDERHPLAARRAPTVEEFLAYPHAVISVVASRMKVLDERLAERGLARKIVLSIPHFLSAPAIIRGTDLVLTIPEVGARRLLDRSGIRILPLPIELPDYNYIQVWGAKRNASQLHRWMRASIRDICAKLA